MLADLDKVLYALMLIAVCGVGGCIFQACDLRIPVAVEWRGFR